MDGLRQNEETWTFTAVFARRACFRWGVCGAVHHLLAVFLLWLGIFHFAFFFVSCSTVSDLGVVGHFANLWLDYPACSIPQICSVSAQGIHTFDVASSCWVGKSNRLERTSDSGVWSQCLCVFPVGSNQNEGATQIPHLYSIVFGPPFCCWNDFLKIFLVRTLPHIDFSSSSWVANLMGK